MMDDPSGAGPDLYGLHPFRRRDRYRNDEVPKYLGPIRGKRIRPAHVKDEIGLAKLPFGFELRKNWRIRG